jgi:pimeloyl-ACP methyl ester carboxylesterase
MDALQSKRGNLSAGVETSFVSVCGHRLEVQRIAGAKAGAPTIVFLHEGLGSVAMWRDFPQRVVEATGCPAVVYSRYGYGQSDPLQASFQVRYMHDEGLVALPQLLDKLGLDAPILFGHSDGGSISLVHAGAHDRVKALILEAPHVFVEDICIESIAAAKVTFATTDLAKKLARYHADAEKSFRGWNDAWLHPDFRAWNIEEYLPAVTCPVLAIQGYDDEYGSMVQLESIERQVQGQVELVKLERCGHSPHRDRPEAVLEAVTRFVAKLI